MRLQKVIFGWLLALAFFFCFSQNIFAGEASSNPTIVFKYHLEKGHLDKALDVVEKNNLDISKLKEVVCRAERAWQVIRSPVLRKRFSKMRRKFRNCPYPHSYYNEKKRAEILILKKRADSTPEFVSKQFGGWEKHGYMPASGKCVVLAWGQAVYNKNTKTIWLLKEECGLKVNDQRFKIEFDAPMLGGEDAILQNIISKISKSDILRKKSTDEFSRFVVSQLEELIFLSKVKVQEYQPEDYAQDGWVNR